MEKRTTFTNRAGFIMATVASVVGLGNMWRFPYLAARHGGGIFILVYVLLVATFGFTLMLGEVALGRKTGQSVIGAFRSLNEKWAFLGVISAIVPVIILSYYCVICGWVVKYFADFVAGMGVHTAVDGYFTRFVGNEMQPLLFMAVFVVIALIVVLMGVKKGIEKVSRILTPVLIVLTIVVTVYSLTLPGAGAGVKYYLTPDFSKFTPQTVLAAMGQMFYSLSLAMGLMVTFGSYMKKDENMDTAVRKIAWLDTSVALMAGLLIVPAVFVFMDGDTTAMSAGPELMFVTMPKVFISMGAAGKAIGVLFFVLVLFAALTSSISLLETVVSVFQDRFKLSRMKSCGIAVALIAVLGVPALLGFGALRGVSIGGLNILSFLDFIANSVMTPVVALLTCIFIGYVIKPKAIADEVKLSSKFRQERMFGVIIKYIAPVLVAAILVSAVLDGVGVLNF